MPEFVDADDYRFEKEKTVLYLSLGIFVFIFLVLFSLSPIIVLIVVGISAALVTIKQSQLMGQAAKISEKQLPEVYKSIRAASERLFMKEPNVFVVQEPKINAFALGFTGRKSVILNSGTVEAMTTDELTYIIGHEFSHIKCGHTYWLVVTNSVESIKIPIVSDIMGLIFMAWSRKTEYTADRGGLIASGSLKASISALAKVTVGKKLFEDLDLGSLIEQIIELDNQKVWARLGQVLSTHPYMVNRFKELSKFYKSEGYKRITGT